MNWLLYRRGACKESQAGQICSYEDRKQDCHLESGELPQTASEDARHV